MATNTNKRDVVLREITKPPEHVFVQLFRQAITAYDSDPREVHDNGRPVYRYRLESSPSYTLKEIEALAREWIDSLKVGETEQSVMEWRFTTFLAWLARREREGRG